VQMCNPANRWTVDTLNSRPLFRIDWSQIT